VTDYLNSAQNQYLGTYGARIVTPAPQLQRGGNSKSISFSKPDPGIVVPSLETILARMSQAEIQNRIRRRPYSVTREYKLFGQNRNARSQVIATITFLPPNSGNYSVRRAGGSSIGEMIVRRVLGREASIAKGMGSSDINQDNYSFRFVREEAAGGHCRYILQMLPRRNDGNLLRGTIWVDATTYLICRVEGVPVKNPSWWVRDVHIVLTYADVGGMWLPTASEYTAKVRLLGPSMMVAHDLRYGGINSEGARNGLLKMPPVFSVSFSSQSEEVH
jgi:hypothetical protein